MRVLKKAMALCCLLTCIFLMASCVKANELTLWTDDIVLKEGEYELPKCPWETQFEAAGNVLGITQTDLAYQNVGTQKTYQIPETFRHDGCETVVLYDFLDDEFLAVQWRLIAPENGNVQKRADKLIKQLTERFGEPQTDELKQSAAKAEDRFRTVQWKGEVRADGTYTHVTVLYTCENGEPPASVSVMSGLYRKPAL